MSSESKEAIFKNAKAEEKEWQWVKAAKSYEKALNSTSETPTSTADIWQKIGFCYSLASRQADELEEFKRLRELAATAYENAAEFFEKEGSSENKGRSEQCKAIAGYTRSWLASDLSEKKKTLEECYKWGHKALSSFDDAGDRTNYGKTCNDLLFCAFELLRIAPTEKGKRVIAQESIDIGDKAIDILSKFDCTNELLRTYFMASLQSWYAANISEKEEERKELAQKSMKYAQKSVMLSKEIDDPYYNAMSRWAAALSTLFFTEKTETALEYAKEMQKQGSAVRDNYIKGIACYLLAFINDWMGPRETDPEKKKERCKQVIKYAEESVNCLKLVSQDSVIAETYTLYAESYTSLGREVEVDKDVKLSLLSKASEIGRKGLEHGIRSGSPDALGSILHALSKALHFYSNLETEKDKKSVLLEEALVHRKEYIAIVERTFPTNNWVLGVGKYYAALVEIDLAKLETDSSKKLSLLENAVSDMESGVLHCRKWISISSAPPLIAMVAGFEDTFGGILSELYLLAKDNEALTRAIKAYCDSAEKFKKVDMPSRAAECYWRIAKNQDLLGEYQNAAESFENAFAEYKAATRRFPEFTDFFLDYAKYTKAWSEIETAKLAHKTEEYTVAMKHYENAADLLKQSKLWNYLSSNFLAWSVLEAAENFSRNEENLRSIDTFKKANELFLEAKKDLQLNLDRIENKDERDLAKRLLQASDSRAKYCLGRIAVEEAKDMDRNGDHAASSRKYEYAAGIFQELMKTELEQTRRELEPLVYLCRAWQKMMMAEAKVSPIMYEEAAELFEQAKEHALDQQTSLLALAHSSFCKALEAGTEYEITRDVVMYTTTKKHMETAANYYLKAGFETASEYAKATQRLFDAYVYMDSAKKETDPKKEAKYYVMAEKVLQISAESFIKAKHHEKNKQVERLLRNVQEERELAMSLGDVLHAPTMASSTASFVMLTPSEEMAVGLEKFEHADIQAKLIQHNKEIRVGEDFALKMQIANMGKEPVLLTKIEEILPSGFQLVAKPTNCEIEDSHLKMKGKRLDPLKTEEIELTIKPLSNGVFEIAPKILCTDEFGRQMSREIESIAVTVSEVALPGRVSTGYEDLDNLLLGGIPENYNVILASPSCDERDLLIKRFIEAGIKEGQPTFYVTIEATGVRALAEEFQSNFYVFVCNPRADLMTKSLPNIFKLKGVENLTDIDIALTKAMQTLDTSKSGPRRACIEIVSDVLLQHRAVTTRRWLVELLPDLKSKGFTTLAVMNPQMHPQEDVQAILGLFDGEIKIYEKETKEGLEKFLRIRKMYNQRYLENELSVKKERLETTTKVEL
jgi:KaiC/GvpD/RAD55 family RecA-like ATPase/type II secretory pathway predicted ATPase ExeA